jgi:hypothetical protein
MVLIKSGNFMMGSPENKIEPSDSESPQRRVNIKQFCIGKYPVTQAQWKAVAALPQINKKLLPDPSYFKGNKRPVDHISWHNAVEFCDRYSSHFTSPPSAVTNPHCGNFTSNFLITITSAGSSFQHSCKKSNPGLYPELPATFSFCIRPGRIFDRATIASCDHFSALEAGVTELLPSSPLQQLHKNMQSQFQQ